MILYPPAHQNDCWNWDGEFPALLTNDYDTRVGAQIGVVNRIVDDIESTLLIGGHALSTELPPLMD